MTAEEYAGIYLDRETHRYILVKRVLSIKDEKSETKNLYIEFSDGCVIKLTKCLRKRWDYRFLKNDSVRFIRRHKSLSDCRSLEEIMNDPAEKLTCA